MNLFTLAKQARKAFEDVASREGQDPQLLSGYCYRASTQLLMAAQEFDLDLEIVSGYYHVFNVFKQDGKKFILDITATQFDDIKEKVFVCEFEFAERNMKHWQSLEGSFKDIESFYSNTFWDFPYACLLVDRIFMSEHLEIPRVLPGNISRKVWESLNECSSRIFGM